MRNQYRFSAQDAATPMPRGTRPLRVLHMGNIGNNAYNNAKLLRAAGVECDVLCPLYYHSMACPEWEDADFEGDVDPFRPAWHRLDLHGFVRPRWFAQGPMLLVVRYLLARRRDHRIRAVLYWQILQIHQRLRAGRPGTLYEHARRLMQERPASLRHLIHAPPRKLLRHGVVAFLRSLLYVAYGFISIGLGIASSLRVLSFPGGTKKDTSASGARFEWLLEEFTRRFPDRPDPLRVEDLVALAGDAGLCADLFAAYDVVQAYATDPIFPLLAGYRPIVAFEHGTLRDIPWEPEPRGRRTALAYALADHVLVTNPDCLPAAERLNAGRVTAINHPWDEDHAQGVQGAGVLREQLLADLGAQHLIFHPARQDWVPGTGYADKANDRFFRALARWGAERDVRVGVVCCEWGANVAESRVLVERLDLSDRVRWLPPMGTVRFERFVLASDLVADQFEVAGMGGVAFKALSAGRPVLMRIDEDAMRTKYGDVPPVLDCRTEEDIFEALGALLEPEDFRRRRCEEVREWMKKHHSGREVVERQLAIYDELSDARPAKDPRA